MSSPNEVFFVVTGDPGRARDLAAEYLQSLGFVIEWRDEWSGTARIGSVAQNVLWGAFRQAYEFGLTVRNEGAERISLGINKEASRIAGGLYGVWRSNKKFDEVRAGLQAVLASSGILES
ncbi:MAG: hypothetical protein HQ526_05105 [Actinobacteria bacterium]|nr:hypothetical protein [Actinomycetota bacterium]